MTATRRGVAILGIFVADLAFRAGRMPAIGETILGSGFKLGPGGKGSNQSVAAARVGAEVTFISKLGVDDFARIARDTWAKEGIIARVAEVGDQPTGAAFIFVDDKTGDNAIIVVAGAAETIGPADVEAAADAIRSAAVFVTQLEQPVAAARCGLEIARAAGVVTVLNPAPAVPVDDAIFALCDYVTPNETEATVMTGVEVRTVDDARRAGDVLLRKGRRGGPRHARRRRGAPPQPRQIHPCAGLQGGAGGGDHRGRGRLQRRLRRGARPGRWRRRRPCVSAVPSPAFPSPALAPPRRCRRSPRSRRCSPAPADVRAFRAFHCD